MIKDNPQVMIKDNPCTVKKSLYPRMPTRKFRQSSGVASQAQQQVRTLLQLHSL